jgi:transcriptional regulator GlxA family with amidase domain
MIVAFPIFLGAEELDLAGPWEAFALARDYGEVDVELVTVGAGPEPVRMRGGLAVVPDHEFHSAPEVDAIIAPGGPGTRDPDSWPPVVEWLKERLDTPLLASVCTGAFLLARAGILDGLNATTHFHRLDELREQHPEVRVVRGVRVVDQGPVVTAGGVTAGIDLGLHLVNRFFGRQLANRVADVMEYRAEQFV